MSSVNRSKGAVKPPCRDVAAIVPVGVPCAHHTVITFGGSALLLELHSTAVSTAGSSRHLRPWVDASPARIRSSTPRAGRNEPFLGEILEPTQVSADLALEEAGGCGKSLHRTVRLHLEPKCDDRAIEAQRPEQDRSVVDSAIDALPGDPDIRRLVEDPHPRRPSSARDRRD